MNLFKVKLTLSGVNYSLTIEDDLIQFTYHGCEPVLLTPMEAQLLSMSLLSAIDEIEEDSK